MKSVIQVFVVSLIIASLTSPSHAIVRHVNIHATGTGDGLTWENAYTDVQPALTDASSGDEIWVAEGTYKVSTDFERSSTFSMKSGVALYGGFSGGEIDKDNRDFTSGLNATILSGNTSSNNSPLLAYHTVTADGVDETAILDGFVVTGGNADGTGVDSTGGALKIINANLTVLNCWISGSATNGGAGAYIGAGSNPTFEDCTFRFSNAVAFDSTGGALLVDGSSSATVSRCKFDGNNAEFGGGIYCASDSTVTVTDCVFEKNTATKDAGGVYYAGSTGKIENCTFEESGGFQISGAVIYIAGGSLEVVRCTFTRNGGQWVDEGGAIFITGEATPRIYSNCFYGNKANKGAAIYNENSSPVLVNNEFVGNVAMDGAAFYTTGGTPEFVNNTLASNIASGSGGGIYSATGEGEFHNLILWANEAPAGPQVFDNGMPMTVSYSNIQEGYEPGTGIISANPKFIKDPLPGLDGVYGTADDLDGDLRLLATENEGDPNASPSIDAGSNDLVPIDLPNLDEDETTEEPTPVDKVDQHRFQDVDFVEDTGAGTPTVVDHGAYETGHDIIYVCPLPEGTPPPPPDDSGGEAIAGVGVFHSQGLVADGHAVGAGESWENPLYDFYKAIELVPPGGEIWMKAGTYFLKPGDDGDLRPYKLQYAISIYGGFDATESTKDERDLENNETNISGETTGDFATYAYTIFNICSGDDQVSIYDVHILKASANNFSKEDGITGAGVYAVDSKFFFCRVNFSELSSDSGGSAVYSQGESHGTYQLCDWRNINGGAILSTNNFDSNVSQSNKIIDCSAINTEGNSGYFFYGIGGSLHCENSEVKNFEQGLVLESIDHFDVKSSWMDNIKTAWADGAAINATFNQETESTRTIRGEITDCLFSNNSAVKGGALCLDGNQTQNPENKAKVILSNVTCTGNSATANGGGAYLSWIDYVAVNTSYNENTCSGKGGGSYEINTVGECSSSQWCDNSSGFGGGGRSLERCDNTDDSNQYCHNESNGFGGAFECSNSTYMARYCIYSCNTGFGPLTWINGLQSNVNFQNCGWYGNFNNNFGAGAVQNDSSNTSFNSCSWDGNGGMDVPTAEHKDLNDTTGTSVSDYCTFPNGRTNAGANDYVGSFASLQLPGDFCSQEHDASIFRPATTAPHAGGGNPANTPRVDFLGTFQEAIPVGPLGPLDEDEPFNTPGFNDPPVITTATEVQVDWNKWVQLFFTVADPDVSEIEFGSLEVEIVAENSRFGITDDHPGILYPISSDPGKIDNRINLIDEPEILNEINKGIYALYYFPRLNATQPDNLTFQVKDLGNSVDDGIAGNMDGVKGDRRFSDIIDVTINIKPTPTGLFRAKYFPDSLGNINAIDTWGATGDPDGDGYPNWYEMNNGTDPNDPDSGDISSIRIETRNTANSSSGSQFIEIDNVVQAKFGTREELDDAHLLVRRSKLTGIESYIERSFDLNNWFRIFDAYDLPNEEIVEEGETYVIAQTPLPPNIFPDLEGSYFRMSVIFPDDVQITP